MLNAQNVLQGSDKSVPTSRPCLLAALQGGGAALALCCLPHALWAALAVMRCKSGQDVLLLLQLCDLTIDPDQHPGPGVLLIIKVLIFTHLGGPHAVHTFVVNLICFGACAPALLHANVRVCA